MVKAAKFSDTFVITRITEISEFINLSKPWFKTVNEIGAGTDASIQLINILKEKINENK